MLYFDTDYLVYLTRPGDSYKPALGCFLGDWTDELAAFGNGAYITEFVSGGPKNYAFQVRCPQTGRLETVIKIRGFTMSFAAGKKLKFKTLRNMVQCFVENGGGEHVEVIITNIDRSGSRDVVTKITKKNYRIVYNKRKVCLDYTTLPFGY